MGRQVSIHRKEVRFENKSESDLLQENQKILIHFCMKQQDDNSWKFLEMKREGRLACLVEKLMDMVFECSIF
jgi:hypothetical protein